jgi:hypothetical protein
MRIGDDRYFDPAQVAVGFATRPLVDMAAKCTIPDAGDRSPGATGQPPAKSTIAPVKKLAWFVARKAMTSPISS